MILLLDLGNTNLCIGIYQNQTLICDFRTDSDLNRSSDMYAELIKGFILNSNLSLKDFEGAILASVIPSLTDVICHAVKKIINKNIGIYTRKLIENNYFVQKIIIKKE